MSDLERTSNERVRRGSGSGDADAGVVDVDVAGARARAASIAVGRPGPDSAAVATDARVAVEDSDRLLAPGSRAGEYTIETLLGEGAFGTVYCGVHRLIGKPAAIKVLSLRHSVDPAIVSRFVDEARAVNRIRHDGIIDIFGFGRLDDGRQYYVMELLAGRTLQEELKAAGPLPVADALVVLAQVAQALAAAHDKGIAHRDVKPANIFLIDKDGARRVKLLDFGIAKLGDDERRAHRTDDGAVVGTPAYMAPEQCLARPVDHRADIYAFGVVAYEALTGRRPFSDRSSFELMHDHVHVPLPSASALRADLPAPIDGALRSITAKDPAQRPATVTAAFQLLASALAVSPPQPSTPLTTTTTTTTTSSSSSPAKRGVALAAAIGIIVVGVIIVVARGPAADNAPATTTATATAAATAPAATVTATTSAQTPPATTVEPATAATAATSPTTETAAPTATPARPPPRRAAARPPAREPRPTSARAADDARGAHEIDPW